MGTIHDAKSLKAATRLQAGWCDWLELRVDNFFPDHRMLLDAIPKLNIPLLVTVRHPAEGGAAPGLDARRRAALYHEFLPLCGLVDIELRSIGPLAGVIREAKDHGAGVILSCHDFKKTPTVAKLSELAWRARAAGADIFKVATMTHGPEDLARLIQFLATERKRGPVAAMGMGVYGKVSRLALGQAGSCLNYGCLGTPNASGQWPAGSLRERLAELREGKTA